VLVERDRYRLPGTNVFEVEIARFDANGVDATNVVAPAAVYHDVAEIHLPRRPGGPDADLVFGRADAERDPSRKSSIYNLPLGHDEIRRLREFAPRFAELCDELAAHGIPETVQHDDLHHANLYAEDERLRLLDWGDASISHPFASLVVTFRFLEEINKLPPSDDWFRRLRDAYLEPWGNGLAGTFALAIRVGTFAHTFAWARQRDHLSEEARAEFDKGFLIVLRRAVAQTLE